MVDAERSCANFNALHRSSLHALICSTPTSVLLLSGYWPVMGLSIAILSGTDQVFLVIPEDERDLASATSSANIVTYKPGSLEHLCSPIDALSAQLQHLLPALHLSGKTVGIEFHLGMQPASYGSSAAFHTSLIDLLERSRLSARYVSADPILTALKARKTSKEILLIRHATDIAADGFAKAMNYIQPGMREYEVASEIQAAFESSPHMDQLERSYGFFYCMSGPNSAKASAAYARTRQRIIREGDLVMIHANTCADGYWTDITRTYTAGEPDDRQKAIQLAIQEARAAAIDAIRPRANASDVDLAARRVMSNHGMGAAFRHATGHGVGFASVDPNAYPRIHPKSPDVLEEGMTFNIEPAAYFDGYGGIRNCDVVAVDGVGA